MQLLLIIHRRRRGEEEEEKNVAGWLPTSITKASTGELQATKPEEKLP